MAFSLPLLDTLLYMTILTLVAFKVSLKTFTKEAVLSQPYAMDLLFYLVSKIKRLASLSLTKIKNDKVPTIEEGAADAGATYVSPPTPFADFHKIDGRVVTGANPASAHSTADAAIKVFDGK
ncbi:hypothetical protein G6F35_014041 [Rhizopus arrhizus]|nr:hypothetical protein G6F35_014041 [Rhizopus arrhizus]